MAVNLLHRPSQILLYLCVLFSTFTCGSVAVQTDAQSPPLVTPISEAVRDNNGDLVPDHLGQQVAVEGVLTSDPSRSGSDINLVNLQDSTAGILLVTRNSNLFKDFQPGDYVRVRGTLSQYKGAEELVVSAIERQGKRPIPTPKQVLAVDLESKRYLAQLVQIVGDIREKPDPRNGTVFVLSDRSGEIPVFMTSKLLLDADFISRMRRGGKANVTGVLGQYTELTPSNSGFRLVLLAKDSVTFSPIPPVELLLAGTLGITVVLVLLYLSRRRRRIARERALSEIDEQRRLLDAVIRQMPAGAVIVDANTGKILFRNEQALRLWQGHDAVLERFTRRALSEVDNPTEEEIELPNHDGVRWLRVATAAIRDHKGRIFAGVVTCYDLTELKRAEATLRVAEKVAVTGRLAATIAHEINNPLAAVTNLLYLVQESPSLVPETRAYITTAQQELSRVAHIVKQTLSFYQSDASPTAVDLTEVIESAIAVCTKQAQSRSVRICKNYMPIKRIQVYASEVRQLVCNILLNAIEAASDSVTIRVYESHDWRDALVKGVRISIADDGAGIPREHRDHIFEPFFTTKGIKGTGLGLWVGRNIVQKHGGEIHVRTCHWTPSSITCFSVFLPYAAVEKAARRGNSFAVPETAVS